MKIALRMIWVFLMLAAGAAHAQAGKWYMGGSLGVTRFTFADDSLPISGATASSLTRNDEKDTGVRVFGGYRFMRNLAVEVGVTDFGSFSATRNMTAPLAGSAGAKLTIVGVHGAAVGILPIDNNFELFGKAGLLVSSTQYDRTASGNVSFSGDTTTYHGDVSFLAGIGAEFHFDRNFGMRVEYEQAFGLGDSAVATGDLSFASVGVTYRF
jgi:OOP family OmpA-OmpF porin